MNLVSSLCELAPAAPEPTYPCLMRSREGAVVLFAEPKCGVLLVPGRFSHVGHWRTDWCMDQFVPLLVGSVVRLEVRV